MRLRRDCLPGMRGCIMRDLLRPRESPGPQSDALHDREGPETSALAEEA